MNNTLKATVSQFLEKTVSQKDVSILIAKDSTEIDAFEKALIGQGFEIVTSVSKLVSLVSDNSKPAKVYISPDHGNVKALYDFLVQYPTGQVEIFDGREMKSKVFQPSYTGSAIVLLILKEELQKFELKNFAFLQYTGLAFQN